MSYILYGFDTGLDSEEMLSMAAGTREIKFPGGS